MSESTARAERRALRRTVGVEARAVLEDTHEAIRSLQQSHSTIAHQFAADSAAIHLALDAQQACCQERWDASSAASKRLGDRHHDFVSRDFMARLRWFLTGR